MYDDASRSVQESRLDERLKYDRSGSVPIILVPQPSNDPNDPLVLHRSSTICGHILMEALELAIMEARPDNHYPFPHNRHCLHSKSSPCCKHRYSIALVQEGVYPNGVAYWLSPLWCRRCRFLVHCICTCVGQKTSIHSRHSPHHRQQRMGWSQWHKLQELALGSDHTRRGACSI